MVIFKELLSEASKAALQELAASEIQTLKSVWSDIEYGESALVVQSVSILIAPKKYIIIDNDWSDTPKEAHDYYFLRVKVDTVPRNIKVIDNGGENYTYCEDHTTLNLGARIKVRSVSVLSDKYDGVEEGVEYDAGIMVELENGKRFSITRQESISGFLVIDHDEIPDKVSNLNVRLVFK